MAYYSRMDGCGTCIKYCFFAVNFLIFIGAITGAILSVITIADKSFANELLGTNLYAGATYVLLITSLLVLGVALIGCFGAYKEVRCILLAYCVCLFLICVVTVVGGAVGYVFRGKVETTLRNGMYSSIRLYGNYRPVTQSWDEIQERLRCCGVDSYKDWKGHLPDACCSTHLGGGGGALVGIGGRCQLQPQSRNAVLTVYQRGCYDATKEYVRDSAVILASVGVTLACFLLVGLILACVLFKMLD